jgi:hypothetical protein
MGVLVVIYEFGYGGVVAAAHHAGGSGLGLDCTKGEKGWLVIFQYTYTSSRRMASPRCWDRRNPATRISISTNDGMVLNLPTSPGS